MRIVYVECGKGTEDVGVAGGAVDDEDDGGGGRRENNEGDGAMKDGCWSNTWGFRYESES